MHSKSSLNRLLSQTAIYGASSTVAKFLNYLLTPFLTRVLTDQTYGEVSYWYAIIPFINVLLTLGFSTGYFRFAARCESEEEQRTLFTTLWGTVSLFAVVFCGISAVCYPSPIAWVMLGLVLVDNLAAMPLSLLRQQGRAGLYTFSNLIGVIINVALCWWFYGGSGVGDSTTAVWVLAANLMASSVSLGIILPVVIRSVNWRVDWQIFRTVAKYSIPLMVAGIMGVASGFIDRLMLRWVLPEEIALSQVGIYSAIARIAALMVLFRQIYTLGAEPFFLQKFKDGDFAKTSAAALKYFSAVGVLLFLGLMLYSDVFALIVGSGFRGGMDILPVLLLANLMAGVLVNLSFWYKVVDRTSYAIIVTMCGVVVSVGLNLLLIPIWGYSGAAWGRLTSCVVMVVVCYVLGQRHCPVRYDYRGLLLYYGLGAIIYIASLITQEIGHSWCRWAINATMIGIYCAVFIRREKLTQIFKKPIKQ